MTRIVSVFFAAVAFLMVVYWVVPGAQPPGLVAAAPPVVTVPLSSRNEAAPARPAMAPLASASALSAPPAAATALPAPVRTARAAPSGCDGDPIRCMLEGRNVASDPTDVTGTIKPAPRKVSLETHGKPAAKLTR
jgi:hypothetical protein